MKTLILSGIAAAILATGSVSTLQAAPTMKQGFTKTDDLVLVGRGDGHGGGFSSGGRSAFRSGNLGASRSFYRNSVPRSAFRSSGSKFYGRSAGNYGHRHRGNRHFRSFAFYGPAVYGYGDGCGWLRRRAVETGSPYWWERYQACRGGYDY